MENPGWYLPLDLFLSGDKNAKYWEIEKRKKRSWNKLKSNKSLGLDNIYSMSTEGIWAWKYQVVNKNMLNLSKIIIKKVVNGVQGSEWCTA